MQREARMRMRILLTCCATLALTIGVGVATAGGPKPHDHGGNSAEAKTCKKGGWKTLFRSDGTPFKNQGACVSYVVRGGTLEVQSQAHCESFGGTFSTDPTSDLSGLVGGTFVWSCNGLTLPVPATTFDTLTGDCATDTGNSYLFGNTDLSGNYSCKKV